MTQVSEEKSLAARKQEAFTLRQEVPREKRCWARDEATHRCVREKHGARDLEHLCLEGHTWIGSHVRDAPIRDHF